MQDSGLVVYYLLSMSWIAMVTSMPSCHRFAGGTKILKFLSIIQSYLVFAFALAMLTKAKTVGSNPECNGNAVVVLFRPFSALHAGRTVGWIVTTSVIAFYTGMMVMEYLPPPPMRVRKWILEQRVKTIWAKPDSNESHNLEFGDKPPDRLAPKGSGLGGPSRMSNEQAGCLSFMLGGTTHSDHPEKTANLQPSDCGRPGRRGYRNLYSLGANCYEYGTSHPLESLCAPCSFQFCLAIWSGTCFDPISVSPFNLCTTNTNFNRCCRCSLFSLPL
jgi:hypothetical protein